LEYYTKTDSVFKARSYFNPHLGKTEEILLAYYRKENNSEKQLYYIDRLLGINQLMETQFAYLNSTLYKKKEFEKNNLLREKKKIEESGSRQILFFKLLFVLGILISLGLLYYLFRIYRKNQSLKKLLERPIIDSITNDLHRKRSPANKLEDEKVEELLEKLKIFEAEKQFTKSNLTLKSLAQKLNTNSHYLSEVINHQLGKNFNSYINELRINYLIDELKSNPSKRKLKLGTLAKESGYANRQSFTRAFHSVTKMPPSYFIEKMEEKFDALAVAV